MKINPIGPNQTEVTTARGVVFHSYSTAVAAIIDGTAYRSAEKHSVTTSRHVNAWLGGRTATEKPQAWFDALAL